MAKIRVRTERCKRCGRCVDICPENLFRQKTPEAPPTVIRQMDCIACGHCVSICPAAAIDHSDFDSDVWQTPLGGV